jgi:hypothetical protein
MTMSNLYGSYPIDQTSLDRGDGQAYYRPSPADLVWSRMLDNVEPNVGAGGDTRNLCGVLLPYDHCQGASK